MYKVSIHDSSEAIAQHTWNRLTDPDTPFRRHEVLAALETTDAWVGVSDGFQATWHCVTPGANWSLPLRASAQVVGISDLPSQSCFHSSPATSASGRERILVEAWISPLSPDG
jgi:hypothetical protein